MSDVKRSREVFMVQRRVCTELEVSEMNCKSHKRSVPVVSDYAESGASVMSTGGRISEGLQSAKTTAYTIQQQTRKLRY